MRLSPLTTKINRLKKNRAPRVLDLFAGCGGFSLGFLSAGFEIAGSVELDPLAARSHGLNFFGNGDAAKHSRPVDITVTEPADMITEFSDEETALAVDVLIGGPPCQAFARVGRAKLRELSRHPKAFLKDPRSNLYLRFLEYVGHLQPLAIVIENVPDALNYGGHNIAEEICEALLDLGYTARYTLLNSVFYGVPQMRERMFLIAYANELKNEIQFPSPTHWIDLPKGYEGSRSVALRPLSNTLFQGSSYVDPPPKPDRTAPAVTAREALQDLAPITSHLNGHLKRGTRRFNELVRYASDVEPSAFGRLMRKWPGFESKEGVKDHVIRSLPRDYRIFQRMRPGDQYPEAFEHAMDIFKEHLIRNHVKRGQQVTPGTAAFEAVKSKFVPPYDAGKFPNKWRKMEADLPARTLMAHLGKDSYSHIHYDSEQARTISVREAARLQSFPDGFIFAGTMNPAFRQIGNAVPPLLAKAIAERVLASLRGSSR